MSRESKLERDHRWYIKYRSLLHKKYGGRAIVVKNQRVIGSYETPLEAVERTMRMHEAGTFVIRCCEQIA
jgi:hypothetical protein